MGKRLLLLGIFFLALALRLFGLTDFPAGFTADEAAQGYTAYSILKTGRDEWGVKFPLNPRSFGDYKAPLQTYLMIPSIAIFGLNELAVRLPNAILGSLAVLVVYLLAKELLHPRGVLSHTSGVSLSSHTSGVSLLAILSAFLLAVSPWHISLSRGAFEANLTTFFLPLAILFFFRSIHNSLFIIPSSLTFGLNLFSYHSAKLVTPLLFFILFFFFRRNISGRRENYYILIYDSALLIFGVFFCLACFGLFQGGGARAKDIGLFSGGWQAVAEQRYFAFTQGLPDIISRIFNNKLTFTWGEFIKNYFSYLSPQFLFTQGAGEASYGMMPGRGLLYFFELPFVLTSFYFLIRKRELGLVFLWAWVFLAPVPASLTRGVGYHANRVAVMMPAIQILSAYGLVKILEIFKPKAFFIGIVSLIFFFSFFSFLQAYFFQSPRLNAAKMSWGWREATKYLRTQKTSKIIISRNFSEPQAFVMFYGEIAPEKIQSEIKSWLKYEEEGHSFIDQLGDYSCDRYEFRNFSFPEDWQKKNVVLVGTGDDFRVPGREIQVEKTINFPDGKIAFRIISL